MKNRLQVVRIRSSHRVSFNYRTVTAIAPSQARYCAPTGIYPWDPSCTDYSRPGTTIRQFSRVTFESAMPTGQVLLADRTVGGRSSLVLGNLM